MCAVVEVMRAWFRVLLAPSDCSVLLQIYGKTTLGRNMQVSLSEWSAVQLSALVLSSLGAPSMLSQHRIGEYSIYSIYSIGSLINAESA